MARGLERAGLERPAYRLLERGRALGALPELLTSAPRIGSDGLPLPPPPLRVQVTHTARADEFIAQGERAAATIRETVRQSGRELEELSSVLDFGCGCGRVMRRWVGVPGPSFAGCDYNPALVEWCAEHLHFARFETNELTPPLPFGDGEFELVYALSVFTHLTEPLQHDWMSELARIVKPGGLVLFSTRGDAWAFKLSADERARYEGGELVVRYGGVEGTNLCAAWHPWSYVHERLATSFLPLESWPAKLADGAQDLHLLERRP